jgi:hypothetical protein
MADDIYTPVIVFDPGAYTGFAALASDGEVLITFTFNLQDLEGFLYLVQYIVDDVEVVVEAGPEYGHHSPITRRAEAKILDVFPEAHRVPPTRWKSHPAYRKRVQMPKRVTVHEHDAIRLGRWYQEIGESNEKGERKST